MYYQVPVHNNIIIVIDAISTIIIIITVHGLACLSLIGHYCVPSVEVIVVYNNDAN